MARSVGRNQYGQLGDGTLVDRTTWTKVLDSGVRGVKASLFRLRLRRPEPSPDGSLPFQSYYSRKPTHRDHGGRTQCDRS